MYLLQSTMFSDACPRGHWSMTGVTPCSPCLQGSYTGDLGTTVCTACPPSQTTLTQGSTNANECTCKNIFRILHRHDTNNFH